MKSVAILLFSENVIRIGQLAYKVIGMFNYNLWKQRLFLVFTKSQETQKTKDVAVVLVSLTKQTVKFFLLQVHQHGRHEVK